MPTVLRAGQFRFFFYAGDLIEPPYVHVELDNRTAKIWLDPVRLQRNNGFRRNEINRIIDIVDEYRDHFMISWNNYFND